MTSYLHPQLPPIALTRGDCKKLERLADSASGPFQLAADMLAREIGRAQLIEDVEVRPGLVKMGSRVTFRDDVSGQERKVTLVYPQDADVSENRISVLTPVGAALIGLSVSQSIEWQTPSGGWRSLTVLKVED
jgi:regulator of nucleoside diphosphate kinase